MNGSSPQHFLRISPVIQPTGRKMSLSPMWTGMILLGSLNNNLRNSAPVLSKIPLQFDFQAKKFQGKWYVIGLAGRNINTESLRHYKMYATMYQLQADHSYRVISNLIKGESCDIGLRTFVPKGQPGQFALDNFKGRTKELRSEPKEKFIEFAQALGLSDEFLLFLHKDDIPSSTVYSPPWLPLPSPSPSLSICC
ncbi:complement component C8 gamma chain isoform X8 [Sarcophilus harrisii]|uniref:complement component C8 gamma chain isoform X8 n=1 Tax=Sarcophilus harrisii TaxID=9305 RepID=UPI001301D67E|nr:complement component C8 gamma chain isoform X8 [Sarcophilus harrisii]